MHGSVIIPAHNESAVIERTLTSLLKSIGDQPIDVFVVCNGCSDDTATKAKQYAPRVQVIETEIGSKIHALNLGDEAASQFPRIYLDADIDVTPNFIPDMIAAMEGDDVRAAWPTVRYETSDSSWIVKAYYYVWQRLPYNKPGRIGVGAYGMNEAARGRFEEFPKIISDDGFVRGQFTNAERTIVPTCQTLVYAPSTASSLVKIRTRSRLGVYELKTTHADVLERHHSEDNRWETIRTILRPDILIRFPIYLIISLIVRYRAKKQMANLSSYNWERDDSSRKGDGESADASHKTTDDSKHETVSSL
ncbi:N-glycosyltransferase [Thalassoglobus neptunius]|uniref:N-glycosyltransferase n=1 Tax=Thalassoglobus neptunius TaxID=1938619 RepID=A0A5C5X1A0_9PLAN|nr:glycosyltransferase [Thalassoglobus neptunius]TWT56736.1 N-glycosyltransferase [Thalassoglobus neptunius]